MEDSVTPSPEWGEGPRFFLAAFAGALEIHDLLRVRREGDAGFRAGGGGELARRGGFAGEFVERVGIDVDVAGVFGGEGEGFAVGRDDRVADRQGDGEDGEAVADAF